MHSEHWAMRFGAIGSVVAWDRIGAMIAHIATKLLHIPLLRHDVCQVVCRIGISAMFA